MSAFIEHLKETGQLLAAFQVGSPEAIADCQRRQRDAQRRAQIELYGACPTCETPYVSEGAKCLMCDPPISASEAWAQRQSDSGDRWED